MSKKNKPILIVTSTNKNYNGEYITDAHNTSGINLHFLMPDIVWKNKLYIKDAEKIFKLKFKIEPYEITLKKHFSKLNYNSWH